VSQDAAPAAEGPPETGSVEYRVEAGVATVRLTRPETMNALDAATKIALRDTLEQAAQDAAVRCVVLTGSGRAFCAGQDLREHAAVLAAGQVSLARTLIDHYNRIALTLASMPKPVLAAVNGIAAGAGVAFALAADLRIAAASSGFNLAFTAIGLSADSGSTWWLPRLVGMARAKELLLAPRTIGAEEALFLGLVTEVVPDEDFPARVGEVAAGLAAGPTVALGAVRRALLHSAGHDLASSLAHEAELISLTAATADHAGAVEAFLAKQQPTFRGE